MTLVKNNTTAQDDFTVTDEDGNLIAGLIQGDFTYSLFDPEGNDVSSSYIVTMTELGSGHYRAEFDVDKVGIWYLIVYHATYFPWGKAGNVQCFAHDFDSLGIMVEFIRDIEGGRWKIDGNQMIFYKEDNVTEIARFNLYDTQGQPTETDVFERERV